MPNCKHLKSIVKDSRKHADDCSITRTRVCKDCGLRFYTVEQMCGDYSVEHKRNLELTKQVNQLKSKLYQIEKIIGGE